MERFAGIDVDMVDIDIFGDIDFNVADGSFHVYYIVFDIDIITLCPYTLQLKGQAFNFEVECYLHILAS